MGWKDSFRGRLRSWLAIQPSNSSKINPIASGPAINESNYPRWRLNRALSLDPLQTRQMENPTQSKPDTDSKPLHYPSAQKLIDEEISRLSEEIRALLSRRNELSPIFRLPPEVICKIFECVQHTHEPQPESGEDDEYLTDYGDPHRWIRVSHVCRRWMGIALSNPSLWSDVVIDTHHRRRWDRESFLRAKGTPLSVTVSGIGSIDWDEIFGNTLIRMALAQLQRITHLSLQCIDNATLTKLLSNAPSSSPMLASLKLLSWSPGEPTILPSTVFTDCTRLGTVSIDGYAIDWQSPIFQVSNLVRLTLGNIPSPYQPSLADILFLVEHNRLLEELEIRHAISNSLTTGFPSHEIHLPRLTWLYIAATATQAAKLISRVVYPDHVRMYIACSSTDVNEADFSTLVSIFSPHIPDKSIRDLKIEKSNDRLQIVASSKALNNTQFQESNHIEPFRSLNMTYTLQDRDVPSFTISACRMMANRFENLESLWIDDWTLASLAVWFEIFSSLKKLETIRLGPSSMIHLLCAMDAPSGHQNEALPFLPSLRSLEVHGILFDGRKSPLGLMEKTFAKRREQSIPIRKLTLDNCVVMSHEDIEKLEQVVDKLEWNGKVGRRI
ncbi:hypothetical protein GALMADRAFT_702091 [Galerina marginata CBS 339.88]|uniref:F-box domain-containing protein n=1 Tax=Galerina marginata (strain CBS 339.88) TaxID=685588 RepID=A0A067TYP7_GALM3|nr:hypothetical protein GALMADRAFT_702091 [Galerina marginata CBS 339.88]